MRYVNEALSSFSKINNEPLPVFTLYFKENIVQKEDMDSTEKFQTGDTFLFTHGNPELPTYHRGKLWQCDSCKAAFDYLEQILKHKMKFMRHNFCNFGTPTNWSSGRLDNRREEMKLALATEESKLNKFELDQEDLDWETEIGRKYTVELSSEWEVTMEHEGWIPEDCIRSMTGPWETLRPYLRKVIAFYQGIKDQRLHYRDFFAFGKSNLVHLSDPVTFFNNYNVASLEMLKNCMDAHKLLVELARQAARSAKGLHSFENPYRDDIPLRATIQGLTDQNAFLSSLKKVDESIREKGLWNIYAVRAEANRKYMRDLEDKLVDDKKVTMDTENIKDDVNKFLVSDLTIESEEDLMNVVANQKKLSATKWLNVTEFVVTRLLIFSSGRTAITNMTVGEWDNREVDDMDGSVLISRHFTKLQGNLEPFIHLDSVEAFLVMAYEVAKLTQFPELDLEESRALQTFFVNTVGSPYYHPTNVPSDFRQTNMSTWSVSTDQNTRANTSFVSAHSIDTMSKVYAMQQTKQQAGIKVLEQYRTEELGKPAAKSSSGRLQFFNLDIPPELQERQQRLRLETYENNLKKALRLEKESNAEQHAQKPDHPASDHSKASLLELIADELESQVPVSQDFLADMIMSRGEHGRKRKYVSRHKVVNSILSAIDKLEDNPAAIYLKNILILAAKAKIYNNVTIIEEEVVKKWLIQFENLGRITGQLRGLRQRVAFVKLAKIADSETTYSLGNATITNQIREMINTRLRRYCHDDETIKEMKDRETTEGRCPRLIEKNPENRKREKAARQLNFEVSQKRKKDWQ